MCVGHIASDVGSINWFSCSRRAHLLFMVLLSFTLGRVNVLTGTDVVVEPTVLQYGRFVYALAEKS